MRFSDFMPGNPDFRKFDNFVTSKARETNLPSVTAGLIQNGKVLHSIAYGFKDIASSTPASVSTLYGVGSITKSFTALCVGKLVEEGKLRFHDKVSNFLPLRQKAFRDVELHHLLTHTSGIPGLGFAEVQIYNALGTYKRPLPISNLDDVIPFLDEVDEWVESKPGKRLFYLNEGYDLLGEVITKASGLRYTEFVTRKILGPLRMTRSFFAKNQIEADQDRATPYVVKDAKANPSKIPYGSSPAGGLVTNVVDLSNYVTMLVNGGEFEGERIVHPTTLRQMETPYVRWPKEMFSGQAYGYGLEIIPSFYGRKVVFHGGSVEVFTASFAYSRGAKWGIVCLSNGTGYSMDRIALYGLGLMMGKDSEELPVIKLDRLLSQVEGDYSAYKGTVLAEVRRNGSFLMLSGEDIGSNIVLVPQSEKAGKVSFYTLAGTAKLLVEFRFNRHGVEMMYERYKYRRTGPIKPEVTTHNA
jgi:CubicO group peptidase (beta-lactamase class C family)